MFTTRDHELCLEIAGVFYEMDPTREREWRHGPCSPPFFPGRPLPLRGLVDLVAYPRTDGGLSIYRSRGHRTLTLEETPLAILDPQQRRAFRDSYREHRCYRDHYYYRTITRLEESAWADQCVIEAPGAQVDALCLDDCQLRAPLSPRILIVRHVERSYLGRVVWTAEHLLSWSSHTLTSTHLAGIVLRAPVVYLETDQRLREIAVEAQLIILRFRGDGHWTLPTTWQARLVIDAEGRWIREGDRWVPEEGRAVDLDYDLEVPTGRPYLIQDRHRGDPLPDGYQILADSHLYRLSRIPIRAKSARSTAC